MLIQRVVENWGQRLRKVNVDGIAKPYAPYALMDRDVPGRPYLDQTDQIFRDYFNVG